MLSRETQRDVLWYYFPPVDELIVMRPLLFTSGLLVLSAPGWCNVVGFDRFDRLRHERQASSTSPAVVKNELRVKKKKIHNVTKKVNTGRENPLGCSLGAYLSIEWMSQRSSGI